MKLPKKTNRYCPYCNKKTEQKISLLSTGTKRGTLKWGSLARMKKRGQNRGAGNKGRYSKKAIKSWKRKSKTTTRKVIIYTCAICKKSAHAKHSRRVSKLLIGEK
jgi:ribosomal protein L44E